MTERVQYEPIGLIHTPFSEPAGMPIQPVAARGIEGTVEVFEAYRAGLKDLDGFSHVVLIYHFHLSRSFELEVVPFLDATRRGVFSTRAPRRPNAIGMSTVRLQGIEDGILQVQDVDIVDGTPLLDIKPYVPEFDPKDGVRTGWLAESVRDFSRGRSDERFE